MATTLNDGGSLVYPRKKKTPLEEALASGMAGAALAGGLGARAAKVGSVQRAAEEVRPAQSYDSPDRVVPQAAAPAAPAPRIGANDANVAALRERGKTVLAQIMRERLAANREGRAANVEGLASEREGLNREADLIDRADRLSRPIAAPTAAGIQRSDAAMEQNYRTAAGTETDPNVRANLVDAFARYAGRQGKMDPTGTEADYFQPGKADYGAEATARAPGVAAQNERRMALGLGARAEADKLGAERTRADALRTALTKAQGEAEVRQYQADPQDDLNRAFAEAQIRKINAESDALGRGTSPEASKAIVDSREAAARVYGLTPESIGAATSALAEIGKLYNNQGALVGGRLFGGVGDAQGEIRSKVEPVVRAIEEMAKSDPQAAQFYASQLIPFLPPEGANVADPRTEAVGFLVNPLLAIARGVNTGGRQRVASGINPLSDALRRRSSTR